MAPARATAAPTRTAWPMAWTNAWLATLWIDCAPPSCRATSTAPPSELLAAAAAEDGSPAMAAEPTIVAW